MPEKKVAPIIGETKPIAQPGSRPMLFILALILCSSAAFGIGLLIGRQNTLPASLPTSTAPSLPLSPETKVGEVVKSYDDGYQAGLEFARQKVASLLPAVRVGNRTLSGSIKALEGNSIVITLDASQIDLFSEGKIEKTFTVSPDVPVEQRIDKPLDQFRLELEKFKNTLPTVNQIPAKESSIKADFAQVKLPTPPEAYALKKVAFGELKVGDLLELVAYPNLDGTYVATSVRIVPPMSDVAKELSPDSLVPSDGISNIPTDSTQQPLDTPFPETTPIQP